MDPLNSYERYSYNQYMESLPNANALSQKMEPYLQNVTPNIFHDVNPMNIPLNTMYQLPMETQEQIVKHVRDSMPEFSSENNENNLQNPEEEIDSKEHLKPLLDQRVRRTRKRGRTSTYWNTKIADKDFAFYGCTICNISFSTLLELDQHVTVHKGRITSYDIKLRNKKKKKLLKKQAKKAKKLGKKVKIEGTGLLIEIKPEDGYIGTEKASEVQDNTFDQSINQIQQHFNLSFNQIQQSNPNQTTNCANIILNPKGSLNQDPNLIQNSSLQQSEPTTSNTSEKGEPNKKTENTNISEAKISSDNIANDGENSKKDAENVKNGAEKVQAGPEKPKTGSEKAKKGLENPIGNNGSDEDPRLHKLFKCFACQKQFALSYYLKLHVRSHTDEKPYTCAVCGESFITASKLGRHNKRMHLSIKFTCRICYRNFNRFENLTRHFDKKHADDKLDGEPYDYNAILPYLKELEDQMQEKKEKEELEKKKKESFLFPEQREEKPKTAEIQELWSDNWEEMEHLHDSIADDVEDKKPLPTFLDIGKVKQERDELMDDELGRSSPIDIVIEAMKDQDNQVFKTEDKVKVKVKHDDSGSEDDYFPSNTWATEAPEQAPDQKPPVKKRYRKQDYPLQCELCDKRISTPGYMRVHMRTHTGEKPYKCYVCDRGFITSSKMHRHVLTHQEFWSDDDEKPLKSEDGIKKEKDELDATQEGPSKKKKESIKRTKARINNKLRVKKEKGERELKARKREHACQFCGKRFLHQATMLVHQKSHEGQELILKCMFCLETQPDEDTLRLHQAAHEGPKPYLCTDCGRTYSKKESMVFHKKSHYPHDATKNPPKSFICDICSKGFNAQCKLQKHLITHNMEKFVVRYECPVCAHMFNTKWHIQMHLQTHEREGVILEENRNEILAMVQQNARKIPLKPALNANLSDLIPADDRSRVCNICGEVFQHFYYLEEHLKSHGSKIALNLTEESSERKHICPVCNKGFKLGYYLKLHSFTHTKEKPYICQTCGKGFITKGKLKRHLETHTGLKKYQCHVCHKFFTRPGYLRIHVRTIHGTQDYNFKYMHPNY